jgi:urease accessory protein
MTIADPSTILRLLAWLSPALPTGAYAYSHGLEWAVESGDIHDGASLFDWLDCVLRHGSGRNDAILLRHAHRSEGDLNTLADLVDLALATQPGAERRAEAIGQGNAFKSAIRAWDIKLLQDLADRVGDLPYAVAVGALTGVSGIDEEFATVGLLQAFVGNLISSAVRLVPLGQTTGLAVLARLEPAILDVAAATRDAGLDDLGGFCFRSDIASMRHETQYTRLFRS